MSKSLFPFDDEPQLPPKKPFWKRERTAQKTSSPENDANVATSRAETPTGQTPVTEQTPFAKISLSESVSESSEESQTEEQNKTFDPAAKTLAAPAPISADGTNGAKSEETRQAQLQSQTVENIEPADSIFQNSEPQSAPLHNGVLQNDTSQELASKNELPSDTTDEKMPLAEGALRGTTDNLSAVHTTQSESNSETKNGASRNGSSLNSTFLKGGSEQNQPPYESPDKPFDEPASESNATSSTRSSVASPSAVAPVSQGRDTLTRSVDSAFRFLRLAAILAVVLMLFSGVKFIAPQEVAIIKRFGKIVGENRADQIHGPGLLFAFPYLIDEVVRVPVKQVQELPINDLSATPQGANLVGNTDTSLRAQDRLASQPTPTPSPEAIATPSPDATASPDTSATLDPTQIGYSVTGDKNIVHATILLKYQISDPIEYSILTADPVATIHDAVCSALMQTLATTSVDSALTGGKRLLAATALRRAQKKLDDVRCGVQLAALELKELRPPDALKTDFDAVVSAYVGKQTALQQARTYRAQTVPAAQAKRDRVISEAKAFRAARLARAYGDTSLFRNVVAQYKANPVVVKERLYRETVDNVMSKVGVKVLMPEGKGGQRIYLPAKISPLPNTSPLVEQTPSSGFAPNQPATGSPPIGPPSPSPTPTASPTVTPPTTAAPPT